MFYRAFIQVDEMCKLLAPEVESQTAIHQFELFTVEYGPVFIDLITMKLNFLYFDGKAEVPRM